MRAHLADLVREELDGGGEVRALAALLVGALHLEQGRDTSATAGGPARSAGGCLPIARLVTERALAVRGADAVRAGVAAAEDDDVLALCGDLVVHRVARDRRGSAATRYSIAKCTPARSRPGIGRSRGTVAPVATTTAS